MANGISFLNTKGKWATRSSCRRIWKSCLDFSFRNLTKQRQVLINSYDPSKNIVVSALKRERQKQLRAEESVISHDAMQAETWHVGGFSAYYGFFKHFITFCLGVPSFYRDNNIKTVWYKGDYHTCSLEAIKISSVKLFSKAIILLVVDVDTVQIFPNCLSILLLTVERTKSKKSREISLA